MRGRSALEILEIPKLRCLKREISKSMFRRFIGIISANDDERVSCWLSFPLRNETERYFTCFGNSSGELWVTAIEGRVAPGKPAPVPEGQSRPKYFLDMT